MAKYSRYDPKNKKKKNDKYRAERKFSTAKPQKNIMKNVDEYDETFDLPSLRRR